MPKVIFFDTETTGTKFDKDRIIEIAAFDPIEKRSYTQLINPKCLIPVEATNIHNISDQMVQDAPFFEQAGLSFAAFCSDEAVLIAHNNEGFDKPFLEEEFKRSSLSIPPWRYLDSLKWARKYRPDLPRHSLQHLREAYGIPANTAHRALDDVMTLYEIFSRMVDDLPIEKIFQLLETQRKLISMPFGKHQGKPLSQVPKEYIRWLADSGSLDKPQNKELREQFTKLGLLVS